MNEIQKESRAERAHELEIKTRIFEVLNHIQTKQSR